MNILITGGASGLGEAITRILAKDTNNKVYFTYSNSELNARKIESDFSNAYSIKCDFKDSESLKSLTSKIEIFELDVLINNAFSGDFLKSHFQKILPNDFLIDFKDNLIPVIEITQETIKSFRKKKSGKIITVLSSALIDLPPIGSSVYVANKAYLEKLTKVWATENVKYNITSNSISPSFMLTKLTSGVDNRIIAQMIDNHPLKKLLTVEEVAETVLFLTNASSQINGIDVVMNSGTNIK
jgi:NAD(P)-dependent dehydrogenase (short-subunit alcohol dehydrogenase family)